MTRLRRWLLAALAALLPVAAHAHGFGRLYNLPVPFWLYAWGAAAALLVSFVVVGLFVGASSPPPVPDLRDITHARWVQRLRRARVLPVLRGLSVFALLLCIATGFFGYRDPYRNFSMTFFWILFVLAFGYLTAVVADVYREISPWRVLAQGCERLWRGFTRGRVAYPERLGDWPALGFYLAFIWIELLGHTRPFSLAGLLLAYTLINLVGVYGVGASAWFRHCEFFALLLRLLGLMAPLELRDGRVLLRRPFAGILQERPERLGTVVFAMFMLASTAFDGLRATQWWVTVFWKRDGFVSVLIGKEPIMAYVTLRPWYVAWETAWLIASPFVYFGIYLAFVALARAAARSERPLRELALDFGYTLLPIALVYNVTHYFTLILEQGVKIVSLLSDPFGWGWNLFGTAQKFRAPILPDIGLVWHTQVGLILLGHIVSVCLAHAIALRVFPGRGRAVASQVPMLGLMVFFTVAGLWILAQPLTQMTLQ